jgi:excisionase family DNA binding protein
VATRERAPPRPGARVPAGLSMPGGVADYLTTKQVADLIGVSDARIRQLVLAGRFPKEARFVGRARLFDAKVVRAWMKAHPDVGKHRR